MTLPALPQIIHDVQEAGKAIDSLPSGIELTRAIKEGIKEGWPHGVVIRTGQIDFSTSTGSTPTPVTNQNILKAAAAVPLYRAICEYRARVIKIKDELRISDADFKEAFRRQKILDNPPPRWPDWMRQIDSQADLNESDKVNLRRFIIDPSLSSHKGIIRGDWYEPALLTALGLTIIYNGIVAKLTKVLSENERVYNELQQLISDPELGRGSGPYLGGVNVIVYGAPGTGKSFSLKGLTNIVRTVFHGDYRNSDFVGTYKPYKTKNEDGTEGITYSFIPGPFISAFVNSVRLPDEEHNLIIEEINRANAATVFGEIFQLLDRSDNGQSEYVINVEPSLNDYLQEELGELWQGKLYIPPNLSLRASMNSADQGVEPMDSAFKRRWEFKYLPIEFSSVEPLFNNKTIPYRSDLYSWSVFARAINSVLSGQGVEEDRLLGPFFLSRRELADIVNMPNYVSGKVLIYLWDDVLRHSGRDWVFRSTFKSFSDLTTQYLKKNSIFTDKLEGLLMRFSEEAEDDAMLPEMELDMVNKNGIS